MLFNSEIFFIFSLIFFCLWPLFVRNNNTRWIFLIAASFLFYGWWDFRYLSLIIVCGMIDFIAALSMEGFPRYRKIFLFLSLLGNLGILFSFKYLTFISENIKILASFVHLDISLTQHTPEFMLVLPVGISFYTFQSMSYSIDVYNGNLKPTRNVFHYFAYLSMFPQLVAGPIIRAKDMLPQLLKVRPVTESLFWEGTVLITHGFFKKIFIADHIGIFVSAAFANTHVAGSGLYWWLIALAFSIQIYCDFSGYSDIARGLAKWMGYEIPINFNHPYSSISLRDFWTRWHISLSSWFRDYVYIPLGGSKKGFLHGLRNMAITMLLSGIWHGASLTFLLWGACHALFLSIERITRWPEKLNNIPFGHWVAWIVTMLQVILAWVIFRAESFPQIVDILSRMITFQGGIKLGIGEQISVRDFYILTFLIGIVMLRELYFFTRANQSFKNSFIYTKLCGPFALVVLALVTIYFRGTTSEFIYFRF
ncbi:MAG: MBOAT family protein [Magnetococcales bacterium]|nr:MBOAT family protein [Magnetococcales bacterium]